MGSGVTIPTQTGFGKKRVVGLGLWAEATFSSFFLPVTLLPATGEPFHSCQVGKAVPCKGENCSMWGEDTLLKSLPRGKVDPSDDWRGTQFHVTGGHIVEIPATDALYQKGNSCHVVFEKDLERTLKVWERKANEEIYTQHSVCATFETQQQVLCFLKPKIMMFVNTGLSLCQVIFVCDSISIANCSLFDQSERARSSVSSILQQLSSQLMSNTPSDSV